MSEKTSWEVELNEDVSPAARKAETALGRLQRMIQRFSASGLPRSLNAVRDRVNGVAIRAATGGEAVRRNKIGRLVDERGKFVREKAMDNTSTRIGRSWDSGVGKLQKFGKTWDKFKGNAGVSKVFESAKTGVMLVAAAAGAVVAGVTVATIKMVDFGQKSRAAFSMMLGSEAAGEQAFTRSRQLAKELGMDIAEVAGSYQRFLSMGFDQAGAVELIKMGADMTALGASSEKVSSVLDAMGKIQATGSLQGDELMMLAEAGINIGAIYDKLGEKFGKTRAQIVKMKEAGKITSADAIQAIKDTVLATTKQTEFGAARKGVIAKTLGGGWDKLKAEVKDKMIGIADASAPALAKALNAINKRMTKILNGKEGSAAQGGVVSMVNWIASTIEENVPTIETFFRAFTDGMSEVLGPMWEMGSALSASMGGDKLSTAQLLGKAIGQLAGLAIAAGAALGGGMLQALISISVVMNDIVKAAKWIIDNIGAFVFGMSDGMANLQAMDRFNQQNGGMSGASNSEFGKLPDYYAKTAGIKQGEASQKNVNQVANINVTAQAPAGGTLQDGKTWGEGAAQGMQRQQLRFFESANLANGT